MHARRRAGLTAQEATPLKIALSVTFLRGLGATTTLLVPSTGGDPDPSRRDSSGDGGPARCLSSIRFTEASSYESYSELPVSYTALPSLPLSIRWCLRLRGML
jgi:hypothetical protein